jgi:2-dehydropantoate 2-reductase
MRTIVYGVGAIGGTVAGALALSGQEVIGIARGAQLQAIQDDGLFLRTPDMTSRARFPCFADPTQVSLQDDDAILLTMKTQDTVAALERLRLAGVREQPIFCVQNGVANERFALRRFPEVHGVTVMMPATFTKPGEVTAFSSPHHGIFDIGRYPVGTNDFDTALAQALEQANIAVFVTPNVMENKYGKLMMNLGNILEAALGPGADDKHLRSLLRAEAETVFKAAGITLRDMGPSDGRRAELMVFKPVPGVERQGGSTAQSLLRGAGSVETDYLNGEIVLLGRLHGIAVPANAFFVELGARMAGRGLMPGAVSLAEIEQGLVAAGVDLEHVCRNES